MTQTETYMDADGNVTGSSSYEYGYDANGNTIKDARTEADADGNVTTSYEYKYEYDANGNIIKDTCTQIEADADGNVTYSYWSECEYDANGNRIRESSTWSDADGNVTDSSSGEYEYDTNGKIMKKTETYTDADGNVTRVSLDEYEYDAEGKEIKHTITETDANGNETYSYWYECEYEYDDDKRTTKTSWLVMDGGSTGLKNEEYVYDDAGNCIKETFFRDGAASSVNEYGYDERGNTIKESHIDYFYEMYNYSSEYEYNADDRMVKETYYSYSADGAIEFITCKEYDEHGNNIRAIYYTADGVRLTEYKYIELKDYLASKDSIDNEEIAMVNIEPVENILSGSGTLNTETEGTEAGE